MRDYYRIISKIPNYTSRFGLFHGLRLLTQIECELPEKSDVVKTYAIPNYLAPIYLRRTISDHAIFWQCLVLTQYDIQQFPQSGRLLATYCEAVNNGLPPLIIDCGGNIGLASVWLATQFPEAILYVVEPDAANFEMLKMNTACFGDRVRPLKGAVWNERADLQIINPGSGSAAFRVAACDKQSDNTIRAYTIDEICELADVQSAFIVKIDIEGGQVNLFKSNTNWVQRASLIILELDDWLMPWKGTSRSFFSCISQYAFDYLLSGESVFCFRDFAGARQVDPADGVMNRAFGTSIP